VRTQRLFDRRFEHTASMLADDTVLAAGGFGNFAEPLSSAERYDPQTDTWTQTAMLQHARGYHTATSLPKGRVLVAGGGNFGFGALASTEIYAPEQGIWTEAANMNEPRLLHTAVLLGNGQVLVAGGLNDTGPLATAELFDLGATDDLVAP
jgi:N-acetylneuraminic acid mutarotase